MINKLREKALAGAVKVDLAVAGAVENGVRRMGERGAKRAVLASNAMTVAGVGLLLASDVAMAAGGGYGVGQWIGNLINDTGVPILEGARWGFYGLGMVGVGSGVNKFVQMSKQQSQVQPKEAFMHVGGGGALMGVGYLADMASKSLSTNQSAGAVKTF